MRTASECLAKAAEMDALALKSGEMGESYRDLAKYWRDLAEMARVQGKLTRRDHLRLV
jgi:beta-galactosidase/beta-glucuronidase